MTIDHAHTGTSSTIHFVTDAEKHLSVSITTDRIFMKSITEEDIPSCEVLLADPEVVEKYGEGAPKTKEEVIALVRDIWIKRWSENNPYSAFSAFENFETSGRKFLGVAILGPDPFFKDGGVAELAGLMHSQSWRQGYGTEASLALIKDYAPATIYEGYTLKGKTLTHITATARTDNKASSRILENLGMHFVETKEKYGSLRHHYMLSLE